MAMRSLLAGVGAYLPERAVSNQELATRLETSDAWIRDRTGIRQRYIAAGHETCAAMATEAARLALRHAEASPEDVDAIVLATSTPDQAFPATALRVQAALGVTRGFGFDLAAACAGFIYALAVADGMIRAGQASGVLVIGSEVYSRILDWNDRGTCVLFGDGAGAVFLRAGGPDTDRGILSTH
ncbi:MAG: 3-oxoacyl-ACP synthase, partial [Acetobacteraceae bacterium]